MAKIDFDEAEAVDAEIVERLVHRHVGGLQHRLFGDDADHAVLDALSHVRPLQADPLDGVLRTAVI